jgi:hypothetical protein
MILTPPVFLPLLSFLASSTTAFPTALPPRNCTTTITPAAFTGEVTGFVKNNRPFAVYVSSACCFPKCTSEQVTLQPGQQYWNPSKPRPTCVAKRSRSPGTLPCFPSIRSSTTLIMGVSCGTTSAMRMAIHSETWRGIWRSIRVTVSTCTARQTRTLGTAIGVTGLGAVYRASWAFTSARAELRAPSSNLNRY